MRHRTKTQQYSTWLKLVKKTNPKTGRKHYSVIADPFIYVGSITIVPGLHSALRAHFDPGGNRGMKGALSWKFSNKEQAEQLITLALMKWGNRWNNTK